MSDIPKVKTVLVPEDEIEVYDPDTGEFIFNEPAKYFIQLATGDLLFFRTRNRLLAQQYVDHVYGKGFYSVKSCKQGSGSGNYTCRGVGTRPSPSSSIPK